MALVGILLAAGRGSRFCPAGLQNKLLQPLNGDDLLVAASARHLLAAVPRVVAVVRPHDVQVAALLEQLGCEVLLCADAGLGLAASLTCALAHTQTAEGWLIALGDMPYVQPATMQALVAAVERGARIAVPLYQGRRGNPVAFSPYHLPLLLALEGDQGARKLFNSHTVCEVPVDDVGVLRDIDTPGDLFIKDLDEENE